MRALCRVEKFMCDDMDRLLDVTRWPLWLRRSFVLAFPITGPAYILFGFTLICIGLVWFIGAALFDLWQ